MSWFFNGDFEDFLNSDLEDYSINFSKKNQELEYFILWLEEESLLTNKEYDSSYIKFLEKFKKVSFTTKSTNTKLWCSEIYDLKKQKKNNSKVETTKFNIDNNLAHPQTTIINSEEFIQEGFIYKEAFGVSGIGTWHFKNKPKRPIFPLVKEPFLNRKLDFSTLVLESKTITYLNEVDDFFQYKGTTLGLNFSHYDWFEKYLSQIIYIKDNFIDIPPPYSIDSFLYTENGKDQVYPMTEINGRKTMGYCTYKLKEKFFPEYRYARLRLIPSKLIKNKINHESLYEEFGGRLLPLSPFGNVFSAYFFVEENLGELNEIEDRLFFTLLDSI